MRYTKILIGCFLLISANVFAQSEANIWYFGENAGLDFNSGTPVALLDGQLNTEEGCATISDNSGSLLFYTDGITVWNRNHQIMLNGTGLNGNISSSNSAIIIPKPLSSNIYYIFTVDAVAGNEGLQYSEVDMSLDNGLGAITTNKNILLAAPVTEKITSIRRNGVQGYWVVAHEFNNNNFLSYSVTSSGVNSTPVISSVGSDIIVDVYSQGCMKISPDRTKLAIANSGLNLQLFDFNASSGVVSNAITLSNSFDIDTYGIEFSPNSEVLYVSSTIPSFGIYQYNLTAGSSTDIIDSEIEITNNLIGFGQLQLATDGKIYIAKFNRTSLDVISDPNQIGLDCDYIADAVPLNSRRSFLGLPPFIQSFFSISNLQFDFTCFGDDTEFSLNDVVDSVIWDFGDPASGTNNSSTDFQPTHLFTQPGTYEVSVTATLGSEVSTDFISVTIYEQPVANPIQDQIVCDDDGDGFYFYDLTQHANDILGSQDPSQFELAYYDGIDNYNNGIPITDEISFELLTLGSANPVISIYNINNPDCEDTVTFQIQVLEGARPSQNVPGIALCDNTSFGTDTDGIAITDLTQRETDILDGQSAIDFTVRYYTDTAYTDEILTPTAYQNTNPSETIYVLVENNNSLGNCIKDTSFSLEILPLPSIAPVVTLRQCDDDIDGFSVFNLTEVYAELSANYQNETISFHESPTDAENGNNPIPNEVTYVNQSVSTDVVYARVENTEGCHRTAQVNLIVSTTQIPLTFTREFYACDDVINGTNTDGISAFDFSMVTAEIEAIFPVGQQLIINYYRNQADALAENDPIADISNYRNIGYPNTQDIYIRVDSALDNDCLGLGEHIVLNVETVPIANPVTIAEQCDADGDGLYPFDTSAIESDILQGQTNVNISYMDTLGNMLPSPLPNPFLSGTQDVTVRVTSTTSQDPNGACFAETTLRFRVQAAAVANPIADFVECDDNNDGFFNFDTSTIETELLNGQTGMVVVYTDTNGITLPSPLPNPFFTDTQTITARVENILSSTCFDETAINFIVSAVPVANTIQDDFVCDDSTNDGEELFTLSNYDQQILGNQSATTFEVLYFDSDVNAQDNIDPLPNTYLVNNLSTPVFARIQNRNYPDCFGISEFQLGVNILPVAATPTNFNVCDDPSNDGEENFILSDKDSEILNGLSPNNFDVKYYLTPDDAENDNDQLQNNFTNTQNPQTIYVRLENNISPTCFTTTQFDIYVREQPVLLMDNLWPICEGESIEIIADAGYDNYEWSNGEMTHIIMIDTPQTLTLRVWNTYDGLICETETSITVVQSNIATITDIEITDWTQNNNSITVNVSGNGDYEYSLDGFVYQDSNTFINLPLDDYTVYVRDKSGCGIVSQRVYLLGAPKFFTPNGDGQNDTWQIINGANEPSNIIKIFDRYGKLLKQMSATASGWDGTFNGSLMPTSDYWFIVERQDGRTYTGHFTLKR